MPLSQVAHRHGSGRVELNLPIAVHSSHGATMNECSNGHLFLFAVTAQVTEIFHTVLEYRDALLVKSSDTQANMSWWRWWWLRVWVVVPVTVCLCIVFESLVMMYRTVAYYHTLWETGVAVIISFVFLEQTIGDRSPSGRSSVNRISNAGAGSLPPS